MSNDQATPHGRTRSPQPTSYGRRVFREISCVKTAIAGGWDQMFCQEMNHPDHEPPAEIDGARVVEWAWSGDLPFGEVPGADSPGIFGLAIATDDGREFFRFSCDRDWESQQDGLYDSIDEAKQLLPDQYRNVEANWTNR